MFTAVYIYKFWGEVALHPRARQVLGSPQARGVVTVTLGGPLRRAALVASVRPARRGRRTS